MDWKKAAERDRMNGRGWESAEPKTKKPVKRGGSHVKPGKVKKWADMSAAEKAAVTRTIRPKGTRE